MLHLHLFQFLLQHLDVIVALDKLCPLIHILVLPFDIRPDGIDTKLNSEVCDSKVDKTLWDKPYSTYGFKIGGGLPK